MQNKNNNRLSKFTRLDKNIVHDIINENETQIISHQVFNSNIEGTMVLINSRKRIS